MKGVIPFLTTGAQLKYFDAITTLQFTCKIIPFIWYLTQLTHLYDSQLLADAVVQLKQQNNSFHNSFNQFVPSTGLCASAVLMHIRTEAEFFL